MSVPLCSACQFWWSLGCPCAIIYKRSMSWTPLFVCFGACVTRLVAPLYRTSSGHAAATRVARGGDTCGVSGGGGNCGGGTCGTFSDGDNCGGGHSTRRYGRGPGQL